MPHATMTELAPVGAYAIALEELLQRARDVEANGGIVPALNAADLQEEFEAFARVQRGKGSRNGQANHAAFETACRNIFYELLVG